MNRTSRARRFTVPVLMVTNWPALQPHMAAIATVDLSMKTGEYREWLP